jgi:hypothetical protein
VRFSQQWEYRWYPGIFRRGLLAVYQRFGRTYCLHIQGWKGDSMFLRHVGTDKALHEATTQKNTIYIYYYIVSLVSNKDVQQTEIRWTPPVPTTLRRRWSQPPRRISDPDNGDNIQTKFSLDKSPPPCHSIILCTRSPTHEPLLTIGPTFISLNGIQINTFLIQKLN